MKKILFLVLFITPLLLHAQQTPQSSSFDLVESEIGEDKCSDGCDNDGDGFIDCEDLDCYLSSLRDETNNSRSRNGCDGDACLLEHAEIISVLGIPDVPTAKDVCSKLSELSTLIANNPFLFIEECMGESDQIPNWRDLAAFVPGDNIIQAINERGGGEWSLQTLSDASGAILNTDYFGVEFESLPDNKSPSEFFDEVRLMLQTLDNGCKNDFNFNDNNLDANSWVSNDPSETVFNIDIRGPENGAVITSQYENNTDGCHCWTFSTLSIFNENIGTHPVSGNRQFGLEQTEEGKWIFYIRGVDRAFYQFPFSLNSNGGFFAADLLWNCLIENVQTLVDPDKTNSRTFGENYRPDWDKVRNDIENLDVTDIVNCLSTKN